LRPRSLLLLAVTGAVLLSLIGCQQDVIETHRVAHEEPPPPSDPKVRLLGAIVPHEQDTWFFKVVGKLDAVAPLKRPFEDFVRSIYFSQTGDAEWKLPEGWERLPDSAGRFATLRPGSKDGGLELTVHRFGNEEQARSKTANVARWGLNDLGIKVRPSDLDEYTHEDRTTADGIPIIFVDMKGPGGKGGGMKPPLAGGRNPHAAPPAPQGKPTYTLPEGWREIAPGDRPFAPLVALQVREDGAEARVTISKAGGGLLANINRWRQDQLGLAPLARDQAEQAAQDITVGGRVAKLVDFSGTGREPKRILAVLAPGGEQDWVIKMQGPADLVGKQKAAFEKFVGSVKFDGGNGG
jgi:hypothetical protein